MRILYVSLGHCCILLGVIGIPLPILPTTPFLLLAAFFYSRGSERFHRWLFDHPRLGMMITEWNRHGVIRPRAKVLSSLLIILSLTYPILFRDFPWGLKGVAFCVGISCLTFINTRPTKPPCDHPSEQSHQAA